MQRAARLPACVHLCTFAFVNLPDAMPTLARPRLRPLHAAPVTFERFVEHVAGDDTKEDLINGRIIPAMSASTPHELVQTFLIKLIGMYTDARDLGIVLGSRTLVRIDERNGYEPDVLFVRKDRQHIVGAQALNEAPDLAVEIVSRSSKKQDYVDKLAGYERAGVREYWIVDPDRSEARFYRRGADGLFADASPSPGEPFESAVLPGFRIDPAVLFQEPLPSAFALLQAMLAR